MFHNGPDSGIGIRNLAFQTADLPNHTIYYMGSLLFVCMVGYAPQSLIVQQYKISSSFAGSPEFLEWNVEPPKMYSINADEKRRLYDSLLDGEANPSVIVGSTLLRHTETERERIAPGQCAHPKVLAYLQQIIQEEGHLGDTYVDVSTHVFKNPAGPICGINHPFLD